MRILPVGDRGVLLEVDTMGAVHRLLTALRAHSPEGVDDVVAGARTVLLALAEGSGGPAAVAASLPDPERTPAIAAARTVSIPVVYDGPDIDTVAELTGMSPAEVARRHSEATYTVGFLGFSPGFGYLFGGDPRLRVARLGAPRTSVPAGSVAVGADMTAVYPQATPGGWRLIGRTDAVMFDPMRAEPALLSPGDRVRFEPSSSVGLPPPVPLSVPPRQVARGEPAVEVLEPGPLLTIQDRGRRAWGHLGVPAGGAADRRSAAGANHMAGNPADRAVLEATLGGCRLRLWADRKVAVTGAVADVTVDGLPARQHAGLYLRAGSELAVGGCRRGVRVYIAIAGGVDAVQVLGSRSTDTLSWLGPAPLRSGDVIPLGEPQTAAARDLAPVGTELPLADTVMVVRARRGPRHDWLSPEGLRALATAEFVVAGSSDRTGVRLEGPPLARSREGDIPSEGMVPGAVQLPPDGRPIILLRNHPTTGGYPVVAVVDDEGVDSLSQAAPGQRLRLRLLSPTTNEDRW